MERNEKRDGNILYVKKILHQIHKQQNHGTHEEFRSQVSREGCSPRYCVQGQQVGVEEGQEGCRIRIVQRSEEAIQVPSGHRCVT